MVEVDIIESGMSPRFVVRASDSRVRLLVFTVQEATGNRNHVWIVGVQGANITVHPASEVHVVERREPTAQEKRNFEHPQEYSGATAPIQELEFGEVPPGFYQPVPAGTARPSLTIGQAYLITAFAGAEIGWREFVA
jgi:hypothetical protein